MAFTDLDTSTVNSERAAIHVVEFFVWWMQAGREYYGRSRRDRDDGLQGFARDAVDALGGWKAARRVLREMDTTTKILIEAKGVLL